MSFHYQQFHKSLYRLVMLLFVTTVFSQKSISQKININNYLDNYIIRRSYNDTANFKGNVYSIRWYETVAAKDLQKDATTFNGKKFNLKSYTEYLPDGRMRYKEYVYDRKQRVEKYYYDDAFKNLILYEFIEDYPTSPPVILYSNIIPIVSSVYTKCPPFIKFFFLGISNKK